MRVRVQPAVPARSRHLAAHDPAHHRHAPAPVRGGHQRDRALARPRDAVDDAPVCRGRPRDERARARPPAAARHRRFALPTARHADALPPRPLTYAQSDSAADTIPPRASARTAHNPPLRIVAPMQSFAQKKELPLLRVRCRRPTRRLPLHHPRNRQDEQHQPAGLPDRRPWAHRRPSHPSNRRPASLELDTVAEADVRPGPPKPRPTADAYYSTACPDL